MVYLTDEELYERIESAVIDFSLKHRLDFAEFSIEGVYTKPNWTNDQQPIGGVEKIISWYMVLYKQKYISDIDEEDLFVRKSDKYDLRNIKKINTNIDNYEQEKLILTKMEDDLRLKNNSNALIPICKLKKRYII